MHLNIPKTVVLTNNMFDSLTNLIKLKKNTKNIKKRFTKKSQRIIICKLS